MPLGLSYLNLHLPGSHSLKDRRSRLKPLLARLHKEFNISIIEYDRLDSWQQAELGFAMICNDSRLLQPAHTTILDFIRSHFPDIQVSDESFEIID